MSSQIVSVSLPSSLAQEIKEVVHTTKESKSQLFQKALRSYLVAQRLRKLHAYGMARALELGIKQEDVDRLIHEYRRENQGST